MKARIEQWGDDLAVRIPRELADEAGIREGSEVEVTVEDGKPRVRATGRPVYTLKELLDGITEENVHPEVDWGPPVGREVW